MKLKNSHSHFHRRALPWVAALLVLLTAGAGAASADSRKSYQDEDRYEDHRGARGNHGHHGEHRYDRDYDDHRYDRDRRHHRRHHRYDRHHRRHHHRHYTDHRYHRRYDDHYYRYNRHRIRHFDIPKLILHELLHSYRPYRYGRVYYSQHRHYHEIYRFPVYTEYGVEYHPYAYCEGKFFGRGHFRNGRPVFDVRIRF